jgi:2-haloalkanoic acid dehalogenase type II
MNQDPPTRALRRLDELTFALEESQPKLPYNENQAASLSALGKELGVPVADSVAEPFGNAPGTWGPFGDTVAGLQKLKRRYKLVILSNIDNENIRATVGRRLAPVEFDAVYTAQDIGSYKPDQANFRYLFAHAKEELGVDREKGDLLHVARSLKADHVPAKELGLRSVWISRGAEKKNSEGKLELDEYEGRVAFEWRFNTIGEFAEEVERQFAAKGL